MFSCICLIVGFVGRSGPGFPGLGSQPKQSFNDKVAAAYKAAVAPKKDDGEIDYKKLAKVDWHDYELMKVESGRTGNGEQGAPFVLPTDPETKKKAEEIYRVNGFSGLTSDYIALNRSLKDIRHAGCKTKKYIEVLPSVSVVVPFHNEHWSTLLRTCYSVMLRSPKTILKEIVLVDDASTKEFLKKDLDDYIAKYLPIVKVVR